MGLAGQGRQLPQCAVGIVFPRARTPGERFRLSAQVVPPRGRGLSRGDESHSEDALKCVVPNEFCV